MPDTIPVIEYGNVMKKLLAILLFAFLFNGYASAEAPAYVIDEAATAAAPWRVGDVVGIAVFCSRMIKTA